VPSCSVPSLPRDGLKSLQKLSAVSRVKMKLTVLCVVSYLEYSDFRNSYFGLMWTAPVTNSCAFVGDVITDNVTVTISNQFPSTSSCVCNSTTSYSFDDYHSTW
jgi:hypothetical protein